ncbi:NAD(P)-binding protein, partial [Pyxidicoccus sp. 3LG]
MASATAASPPARTYLARVHIYGGGISGLTAAHELARRGFRVVVYEPAQEYDELGLPEGSHTSERGSRLAVGGLARSQFLRVPKGALGNFPEGGPFESCDEYRLRYQYSPDYVPSDGEEIDNRASVSSFVTRCGFFRDRAPGILHIRIPWNPEAGNFGSPGWLRYIQRRNTAHAVRDYLSRADPLDRGHPSAHLALDRVLLVGEQEEDDARRLELPFPPLEDRDELHLEVLHFLPGEHGFRFFPSYYRNLFSTLVEIPLLDAEGHPTGRRVFDNLVPSGFYGIAAHGRSIRFLRRAPATRPYEMLKELRELTDSGYPPTDTLQLTLRIWRYLCTCSERRKAEYERISWWEYLEGHDPKTGARRYHYSDAFKRDTQFAPRVLAAFDGAWGDARTNGNTLAQLYLNNLLPMPKTDGTLNGPTTLAWFRPWRRFLEEYLGVEFREARVTKLELAKGQLVPHFFWVGPPGPEYVDTHAGPLEPGMTPGEDAEPVDYYVLATDAKTAETLTQSLPRIGVVDGLRGFTTRIPPNPRGPEKAQPRQEGVLPGNVPWDRFQTLTGIQFFFPSSVRLAEGYLYFLDAPWGLSAISSQQYWAVPPTLEQDGFASVLSVDIGNWYVREPELESPSRSSRRDIAREVWRQIREATEQHEAPLPDSVDYGFKLPEPSWFHMDRFIRFEVDPVSRKERPVENRAPYLIPVMDDWDHRPGTDPWDPLAPPPEKPTAVKLPEGLWQAPHGGYQVHWGKLVFAGTYLRTFTRMTTMESANESARHAVNAIIDHYLAHHPRPGEAASRSVAGTRAAPTAGEYGEQGSLTGTPAFRMTPIGEYCRIWDPEKHELPELVPLRELDAKLFAAGLPHVWDVLHLEPLALPLLSALGTAPGAEALRSFLDKVRAFLKAMPWPHVAGHTGARALSSLSAPGCPVREPASPPAPARPRRPAPPSTPPPVAGAHGPRARPGARPGHTVPPRGGGPGPPGRSPPRPDRAAHVRWPRLPRAGPRPRAGAPR